jgi:hypothetical protein
MKSVAALWGYREAHDDPKDWKADVMANAPLNLLDVGTFLV